MDTQKSLRRLTPLLLLGALVGCPQQDNVSVVITPETVQVGTFRKHQFIASVSGTDDRAVFWSVQEGEAGGSVDFYGVYTAPATPGTYHLIATTRATPVKKASATVTVVEALPDVTVSIEPAHQQVRVGESATFSAQVLGITHPSIDTSVTWSVQEEGGGTISSEGVYTAPTTPGEYHVVATSRANPERSATARVEVRHIVVAIAPAEAPTEPLYVGGRRVFRATVQGTDNQAVTWSLQGEGSGSVEDEAGLGVYTAPATPGTYTLVATSVEDPESVGTLQVEVLPAPVLTVTILDGAREVNTLETLQLQADVTNDQQDLGVTWSVKAGGVGGTIDAQTGLYTAPATGDAPAILTDTLVATSVEDDTKSAEVVVTVRPLILTVEPQAQEVLTGETLELAAAVQNATDTGVEWTLEADADDADGTLAAGSTPDKVLYTAPSTPGSDTVRVTSKHDPNRFTVAVLTVKAPPPVEVTVAPAATTLFTGTSVTLTATVANDRSSQGVTWSLTEAEGGTLVVDGLTAQYTAPSTPGEYHVVVKSVADDTKTATATLTVQEPVYDVSVSPVGPVSVNVGQTQQFTAVVSHTTNTGVTWSVKAGGAGGTVDATGLYTAPAVVGSGTDTVVATSNDDPAKSAEVQVAVTSTAQVSANIDTHEMLVGETVTLTATVTGAFTPGVTWSVPADSGTLSATTGSATVYTAPATAGTYTVTLTSDEDPSKKDTVVLTVYGQATTGLYAHFAADKLGAATGPNGEVSEWTDLTSSPLNLTQTDTGKQPRLVPNALNGKPAVRFDGEDDYLKSIYPDAAIRATIFIVHNSSATANLTLFDSPKKTDGTINNERNRIQMTKDGSVPRDCVQMLATNSSGSTVFASPGQTCSARGVFHAVMAFFNGADSRLRVDGADKTWGADNNGTRPGTSPLRGIQLGLRQELNANGTSPNFLVTELAEVLVYEGAMSQADIEQVEAYLRFKYGLPNDGAPQP